MSAVELSEALQRIASHAQPHFSLPGRPARVSIVMEPWRVAQLVAAAHMLNEYAELQAEIAGLTAELAPVLTEPDAGPETEGMGF